MSTPDILDTLLPDLEGPVPPDPAFAARLRRTFVAASGHQQTTRPQPLPVVAIERAPIALRPPRRRWLDMAAVAVLLLSMIGGIARVTNTATTPTPAIQAPDTEQPIISAAQDGKITGPAPTASEYSLLWNESGTTSVVPGYNIIHGRLLYRIVTIGNSQNPPFALLAQDLYSGETVWQREIASVDAFELTTSGVVVGLSASNSASPVPAGEAQFHLALLDLQTGRELWQIPQSFDVDQAAHGPRVFVEKQTLIYSDNRGTIFAFAMSSGEPLWSYAYNRAVASGANGRFCYQSPETPQSCVERSEIPVSIAIKNGTLYASDMVTIQLFALDSQTGSLKWSTSVGELTRQDFVAFGALVALDDGVLISYRDVEERGASTSGTLEKRSVSDGVRAWAVERSVASSIVVTNEGSLFTALNPESSYVGLCCDIVEINAKTGEIVWQADQNYQALITGYLVEEDTVLLQTADGPERVFGLDARTHNIAWSYQLDVHSCYRPIFPLATDGTVACMSADGLLGVYKPTVAAATPVPSPVATEQSIMASGSAAMDGSWPGPAPANTEYRLLWRGQPPATGFVAPFQGKIYQVVERMSPASVQALVAYDAKTGAELWSQPVAANFTFAVTSAGVVAGIPDSSGGQASPAAGGSVWDFQVVLLDLDTGKPIWRSAEAYQLNSQPITATQIAGDTILFIDRQMTLVALDLATGRERWRVESTMPPPAKCGCFGFGPAIAGDTVYFDNPVTGQIVAVSLSSGEQKWAIDDPVDRTPGPVYGVVISGPIALGAVDQGVVVNTWWLPSGNSTGTFGLLSAADGSPIWQWGTDKQIQDFARVGDALIVITRDAGETDWRLERVDLATGKVLQTSSQAFNNGFYLQYLPEADMVIVSNMENTERVGVNPATLAVRWTAPVIEDCRILLPAMPNGNLACRTQTGLAVYQPVTAQNAAASPTPHLERADPLVSVRPDVVMREEPAAASAVAATYPEAGTQLEYVDKSVIDAEGTIWYQVRDPRTARVGWIPAVDLEVANP